MDLLISRPSSEWLLFSWSHPFPPILLPSGSLQRNLIYIILNQFIIIFIDMVKLHTSLLAITLATGSALAASRPRPVKKVNDASASGQR